MFSKKVQKNTDLKIPTSDNFSRFLGTSGEARLPGVGISHAAHSELHSLLRYRTSRAMVARMCEMMKMHRIRSQRIPLILVHLDEGIQVMSCISMNLSQLIYIYIYIYTHLSLSLSVFNSKSTGCWYESQPQSGSMQHAAAEDIKPRNWVYEADGQTIKLIDFGFSVKGVLAKTGRAPNPKRSSREREGDVHWLILICSKPWTRDDRTWFEPQWTAVWRCHTTESPPQILAWRVLPIPYAWMMMNGPSGLIPEAWGLWTLGAKDIWAQRV